MILRDFEMRESFVYIPNKSELDGVVPSGLPRPACRPAIFSEVVGRTILETCNGEEIHNR